MKVDIHILGIISGDSVHTVTESKFESQLIGLARGYKFFIKTFTPTLRDTNQSITERQADGETDDITMPSRSFSVAIQSDKTGRADEVTNWVFALSTPLI